MLRRSGIIRAEKSKFIKSCRSHRFEYRFSIFAAPLEQLPMAVIIFYRMIRPKHLILKGINSGEVGERLKPTVC